MPNETAKKTTRKKTTKKATKKATVKKTAKKTTKKATRKKTPRKAAAPRETPSPELTATAIKESLGVGAAAKPELTDNDRHRLIAQRAYRIAVRRGFRDGNPLQDWLAAEAEVDREMPEGGSR